MSASTMVRRFEDVPLLGATVEAGDPLVGWRVERSFDGRFLNFDADGTAATGRCSRTPTGIGSISNILGAHQSPNPWCECGVRLVGDRGRLSQTWEGTFKVTRASGLGLEFIAGTTDLVLLKAEATGHVTPGHAMPADDPFTTIRAGNLRVLECFTPPWVDASQLARWNPNIAVRPIADLDGIGFTSLRAPHPPEQISRCQSLKHHLRVVTGVGEILVPRSWMQAPGYMDAVWGVVNGGWGGRPHLQTIINRLVVPLTDLEDPHEMQGCALGLTAGLAALTDAEAPELENERKQR